jgi:hypothetical protein
MNPGTPFDSIESAKEFVDLLARVVLETRHGIEANIEGEAISGSSRGQQAMQLVAYKLWTLETHLKPARRILNDLRSLRRLLLGQRADAAVAPAKAPPVPRAVKVAIQAAVAPAPSTRPIVRKRAISACCNSGERSSAVLSEAVPWYVRTDFSAMEWGKPLQRK